MAKYECIISENVSEGPQTQTNIIIDIIYKLKKTDPNMFISQKIDMFKKSIPKSCFHLSFKTKGIQSQGVHTYVRQGRCTCVDTTTINIYMSSYAYKTIKNKNLGFSEKLILFLQNKHVEIGFSFFMKFVNFYFNQQILEKFVIIGHI